MSKVGNILFCLILLLGFNYSSAQLGSEKLVSELETFYSYYYQYAGVKEDYSVEFIGYGEKYFAWNGSNRNYFRIEEVLNRLDSLGETVLLERAKAQYIDRITRPFNDQKILIRLKKIKRDRAVKLMREAQFVIINDSLVNLEDPVFVKSRNGWFLSSRLKSLKVAPPKRADIKSELVLFCYASNANDKIDRWRLTIDSLERSKFAVGNGISDLVYSDKYKRLTQIKVPRLIDTWINQTLQHAIESVPPGWRKDVALITISYDTALFEEKLWLRTSSVDKIIYLSPFIVRAAYISFIHLVFSNDVRGISTTVNDLKTNKMRTYEDDRQYYYAIKNRFQREFIFVLLHELAHIKFGEGTDYEEICDCEAARTIIDSDLDYSTGLFEDLMVRSIQEGKSQYWDMGDPQQILTRLKLLKDSKGGLTLENCLY